MADTKQQSYQWSIGQWYRHPLDYPANTAAAEIKLISYSLGNIAEQVKLVIVRNKQHVSCATDLTIAKKQFDQLNYS